MIPRNLVKSIEEYSAFDNESFSHLWGILNSKGYTVSKQKMSAIRVAPGLDTISWLVSDKQIASDRIDVVEIDSYGLLHQGMHVLFAAAFGSKLRGRPLTTLLSEAFAVGIDHYYLLLKTRQVGFDLKDSRLRQYAVNSERLRRPFIRQLNFGMSNPFQAYKNFVLDHYRCSTEFLKTMKKMSTQNKPRIDNRAKTISRLRNLIFFHHKNFPLYAFYAFSYCGESTVEDEVATRKALRILRESTSMASLLQRLEKAK